MKNRKEFIECVYSAEQKGLEYPKFSQYKDFDECNGHEIMTLFNILAESGNSNSDEDDWILADDGNSTNEIREGYELNACILMIALIVNSRGEKSEIKFESRLRECYHEEKHKQRKIENLFNFMGSAYQNSLRNLFSIAKEMILHYGTFDMVQLFNDVLDWEYDREIACKWAREIVSGRETTNMYED